MNILVTGGAGYIGAHTVRQLLAAGHDPIIIDNLTTGQKSNVPKGTTFVKGDFGDSKLLEGIFTEHSVDAVMHFAANTEINESIEKPLEYLENNTLKTGSLIQGMLKAGVKKLIFASTAAVYGDQKTMPITETAVLPELSPYGSSKLLSEQLIAAYTRAAGLNAIVFRFFNACGSDFDKQIYPTSPSTLIPQVINAAEGRAANLTIYGTDFETIDGTGVRDYVHVLDIARAHVAALGDLNKSTVPGASNSHGSFKLFNIGTGTGWSVKQIVAAAERVTGKTIPFHIAERRPIDVAIAVADNTKIRTELGFELKHSDLDTLIETSWH